MSLILVEDTLVSATDMSFSSEVWIDHSCNKNKAKVLFWQSPGYASLDNWIDCLRINSVYPRSNTFTNNCFSAEEGSILKSHLSDFAREANRGIKNYLNLFKSHIFESPSSLPYICYKNNISVGAAITQCLLTYFPDSHFEIGRHHTDFIIQVCEQIISGIELLTFIHQEYNVDSLILSEHVYNAAVLVEFAKKNDIKCPRLHDAIHSDTPCSLVNNQGHRSEWHSQFAHLYKKRKELCHKNLDKGKFFLESLANRMTNINQSDNDNNRSRMNLFLTSIDPSIQIFTPKEFILHGNNRMFNVVVYLDTYSDAAYSLGSAGYVSSVTYFLDCASKLVEQLGKDNISFLLKLHPNMFLPDQDPTAHRKSIIERDKHIIAKLYHSLKNIVNVVGVISPESTPRQISTIPSLLNITHHGTVGLELMHLKSPVLYTICSPYAGLQISTIEVNTKQDLDFYIKEKSKKLFDVSEYNINFDILYSYMYAWQFSPEMIRFKLREEINNMQAQHISLEKCLQRLESRSCTIKELVPENIVNCYTHLSRLALNDWDA